MRLKIKRLVIWILFLPVIVFALYLSLLAENKPADSSIQRKMPFIQSASPQCRYVFPLDRNSFGVKNITRNDGIHGPGFKQVLGSGGTDCINVTYPFHLGNHESWYPVDDVKSAYVFSAYYDERDPRTISVIGTKLGRRAGPFFCQLWTRSADGKSVNMTTTSASSSILPEGHDRRYYGTVITCTIGKEVPESVSIVTQACSSPLNLLTINRGQAGPYTKKFTVCLTPLNLRYGRAYELVEWIELNRILGADSFTFYNYSIAKNVARVLEYYKDRGIADVVNWNLPMGVDTWPLQENNTVEIHYFGQTVAHNDCWRRNRQRSEYLVYTDLDEFIVPRASASSTWHDIIKLFPSAPAFMFQNVFFRKEWDALNLAFPGIEIARKYKLTTLLKTVREKEIFTFYRRSKYIVRSDSAKVLGVHQILRLRSGFPKRITAEVGLLYHYRNWESPEDTKSRDIDNIIVDKYGSDVIDRVRAVWSELPDVELDIPI